GDASAGGQRPVIPRLLLRVARDLALVPVSAFLIYHAVSLLPLANADEAKMGYASGQAKAPDVVELEAELGVGEGALGFLRPWRMLFSGARMGTGSRQYTLGDIGQAFAGSLRIGGLALLFALLVAVGYALSRALLPPGPVDRTLELVPTLVYGTPSFIL